MRHEFGVVIADAGYTKLAVISGVGVRNYYRRLGYEVRGEGQFMIKDLTPSRGATATAAAAVAATTAAKVEENSGTREPAAVGVGSVEVAGGSGSGAGGGCVALAVVALGAAALMAVRWK